MSLRHGALGVALLALSPHPSFAQEASLPEAPVTFSPAGIPVGVPAGGMMTLDEPMVALDGPFGAWMAVAFADSSGRHEYVAVGAAADPEGRPRMRTRRRTAEASGLTVVNEAGALIVESAYGWDARVGSLRLEVTLRNRGTEALGNVEYRREWSCPPGSARVVRAETWQALAPGASCVVTAAYAFAPGTAGAVACVPLSLWTDATFPSGLPLGLANGVSFGDYDADGDPDLFVCNSANLFRNEAGLTWTLVSNLVDDGVMPEAAFRYGAHLGDYNNDGLPDWATAPRMVGVLDQCFRLLQNLEG